VLIGLKVNDKIAKIRVRGNAEEGEDKGIDLAELFPA